MNHEKATFISTMRSYGRAGMLKLMRAWGFTAHKMDDEQLAIALWTLRQRATKGGAS